MNRTKNRLRKLTYFFCVEWMFSFVLVVMMKICSHCYGVQQEPTGLPLSHGHCCQQKQ